MGKDGVGEMRNMKAVSCMTFSNPHFLESLKINKTQQHFSAYKNHPARRWGGGECITKNTE